MKNLNTNLFKKISLIFFIICFFGCDDNPVNDDPIIYSRGDIKKSTMAHNFSTDEIVSTLSQLNINIPYPVQYSVEYVTIIYHTIDYKNNLVEASGSFFIPVSNSSMPLLSLQHGTEVKRENVSSTSPSSSVEGITGLLIASLGYATAVPDYIGFGISNARHPYLHTQSLSDEVIDFIKAVKIYSNQNGKVLNEKLFLTGYSEGGLATLAVQKDIEENYNSEFSITAAAPMSGPYDLNSMTMEIFNTKTYPSSTYIAYLLTAYNEIYNWNKLDHIFKSPYSGMVENLFDGTLSWGEIDLQMPSTISGLLKDDFVTNYLQGTETEIAQSISENTILDWSPKSPIAFIHGTADKIVPYQNAETAYEKLSEQSNTEITLIPIEGGTHASSGLRAIILMLGYFDQYRNNGV